MLVPSVGQININHHHHRVPPCTIPVLFVLSKCSHDTHHQTSRALSSHSLKMTRLDAATTPPSSFLGAAEAGVDKQHPPHPHNNTPQNTPTVFSANPLSTTMQHLHLPARKSRRSGNHCRRNSALRSVLATDSVANLSTPSRCE